MRSRLYAGGTRWLVGEVYKRLWLLGAVARWQERLPWSLLGRRASAGPGNMPHEKYGSSPNLRPVSEVDNKRLRAAY